MLVGQTVGSVIEVSELEKARTSGDSIDSAQFSNTESDKKVGQMKSRMT